MGHEATKTEHSGAKKGNGAYWGRKVNANTGSAKARRSDGKREVSFELSAHEANPVAKEALTSEKALQGQAKKLRLV